MLYLKSSHTHLSQVFNVHFFQSGSCHHAPRPYNVVMIQVGLWNCSVSSFTLFGPLHPLFGLYWVTLADDWFYP